MRRAVDFRTAALGCVMRDPDGNEFYAGAAPTVCLARRPGQMRREIGAWSGISG
jgi:hypothetical protein